NSPRCLLRRRVRCSDLIDVRRHLVPPDVTLFMLRVNGTRSEVQRWEEVWIIKASSVASLCVRCK
ncbi:unnamed protein product, partial [Leuciscus chuanchicus]